MNLKVPIAEPVKKIIQTWFPRPLNRGEHFTLDHYKIFYANKNAKVILLLKVKNKTINKVDDEVAVSEEVISRTFDGLADNNERSLYNWTESAFIRTPFTFLANSIAIFDFPTPVGPAIMIISLTKE